MDSVLTLSSLPLAFSVSHHDMNRLAIADKDGKVVIYDIVSGENRHSRKPVLELKAGIWKNAEILAWHPLKEDWLCSVEKKYPNPAGDVKYSASCYDLPKDLRNTNNTQKNRKVSEKFRVSIQSQW